MKVFFIFCFLPFFSVYAETIEIFYNDDYQVTNNNSLGFTLIKYNLDELSSASKQINININKQSGNKQVIARSLVNKNKKSIQRGFLSLTKMKKYNIKKIPAISFEEGKFIYYGNDLTRAIKLWQLKK